MRRRRTDMEDETDHHRRKRFRRPKKKSKGAGGFGPSTAEMLIANYKRLASNPTDFSVWMKRRLLVGQLSFFDWEKELSLIEELADAKKHRNNYLIWDHRRWVVEKIGSESAFRAIKELEFTKKILTKGKKNCQAWLYREWIIRKFDKACLWWSELSFCHEILEKDIFNVSAWDQICRVARELNPDSDSEFRDSETKFARKSIQAQPGNEGPWVYLRLLYEGDKRMLFNDPNLECIYVNVLAEGADRWKTCIELDPHFNVMFALVDCRGFVLALNLILDLMTFGYKVEQNPRLLEAVNFLLNLADRGCGWLAGHVISGMAQQVFSLTHSIDAFRMRFCHMSRAFAWEPRSDSRLAVYESPRTETEANQAMYEISPPSREKFESFFYGSVSEHLKKIERTEQEILCETFYEAHLQNVRGQGIAEDHSFELVKWELRRFDVKIFGGASAALDELQYTTNIIEQDATNHHAWSHRQWLFQAFGEVWEDETGEEMGELELDFCKEILENDSCNIFAWDQRHFVVKRGLLKLELFRDTLTEVVIERFDKLDEELERKSGKEILFAKKFIASEAENPFPWCHMFGVTRCFRFADYGSKIMVRVLDAMLRVLEDARDCCAARGVGIGEGGGSCINGRGVQNVLNMLFNFRRHHHDILKHPKSEERAGKLYDVLADLCPGPVVTEDVVGRLCTIFDRLRFCVEGNGLGW